METQKNRGGKENDLRKDAQPKSQDSQRRTPEASTKKSSQERSQGLREDRSQQHDKDASKNAPKQPRK